MHQLARRQPLSVAFGHNLHCIDVARQFVMCNAPETLLYTRHNTTDGAGQMRKCRNWSALSKWAGEHQACFVDDPEAVASEDRSQCRSLEDGDGIIMNGWKGVA